MSSHSNSLVLAKLYEHVSRRGRRYFVGRMGAVKVLMVEPAASIGDRPFGRSA